MSVMEKRRTEVENSIENTDRLNKISGSIPKRVMEGTTRGPWRGGGEQEKDEL